MKNLHTFIHFPENIDDKFDGQEVAAKVIKDFQMALDLADCEMHSTLYYCKTNKDTFFDNIKAYESLMELNIGAYNFEAIIDILFADNGIKQISETKHPNCIITSYNSHTKDLDKNLPMLFNGIINKAESLKDDDLLLMMNFYSGYFSQNPILLILDCLSVSTTVTIPYVVDFTSFDKWLQKNRMARSFNNLDTRHIENSGNHRRDSKTNKLKSPLIGGIGGRKNAESLLTSAIGDKRSTSNASDLMEFDETNGEYIWYEYENVSPQNIYHAYHLVEAFTYKRDTQAVGRIPSRVLKIFEYRKELLNSNSSG